MRFADFTGEATHIQIYRCEPGDPTSCSPFHFPLPVWPLGCIVAGEETVGIDLGALENWPTGYWTAASVAWHTNGRASTPPAELYFCRPHDPADARCIDPTPTVCPEPSYALLLATGVLLLAVLSRWRRRWAPM